MKKLLLIEDHDPFRHVLTRTLVKAGYEVRSACHGREALACLNDFSPDWVLTDIVMPEMEGLETIVALRAKFPHLRVIAMSGGGRHRSDSYLQAAQCLGAEVVLRKPFDRAQLLQALAALETSDHHQETELPPGYGRTSQSDNDPVGPAPRSAG